MHPDIPDLGRIQAVIEAERRAHPAYGLAQRTLRTAMLAAVALAVVVFFIPALVSWDLTRLTGLTPAGLARRALVVLVGAAVASILTLRTRRRAADQDPATAAQMVAAEWQSLIGPDWWKQVLRQGVLITAGVGVPVGLVLAFRIPENDLDAGGRVGLLLQFLGLTAAWALPAAFGIRWLVLRTYRRMIPRASGHDASPAA